MKYELLMKLYGTCKKLRFHTGLCELWTFVKDISPAPQSTVIQTSESDSSRTVFTKCIEERCNWEVECVC